MQPAAQSLEVFPSFLALPFRGLSLFPSERTMRDPPFLLLLPRTQLPAQPGLAVSPRCFSAVEASLRSVPARGDRFGQSVAEKGPRTAIREGRGFPNPSLLTPGPRLAGSPRGAVWEQGAPLAGQAQVVLGTPNSGGGPQTEQAALAVRLASCIPAVLVVQRAKPPALCLLRVREWCRRLMERMMKDPANGEDDEGPSCCGQLPLRAWGR